MFFMVTNSVGALPHSGTGGQAQLYARGDRIKCP